MRRFVCYGLWQHRTPSGVFGHSVPCRFHGPLGARRPQARLSPVLELLACAPVPRNDPAHRLCIGVGVVVAYKSLPSAATTCGCGILWVNVWKVSSASPGRGSLAQRLSVVPRLPSKLVRARRCCIHHRWRWGEGDPTAISATSLAFRDRPAHALHGPS